MAGLLPLLALAVLQTGNPSPDEAFAAAREHLPERLRARVTHVALERKRDYGVPPNADLDARLFGRAAMAYHDGLRHTIVVTDAGASGVATWGGAEPRPDVLERFLDRIAPALGDVEGVEARWAMFRGLVAGWTGTGLEGEPGDVAVLDAFLAEAPWRALGERLSLEELLCHEFAHALQLEPDDMPDRVRAWSAVTGWRERHDGSLADGLFGRWLYERPAVLVRLVLGGERGKSEYLPVGTAPNLYALFDPREDFAEAVRLMAYHPERLAEADAARFLCANATGWIADRDAKNPGPLWRGAENLGEERFRAVVAEGARELVERWVATPDADPSAFAAVLRAHGPWIAPDVLPAEAEAELPTDLPPGVARVVEGTRFTVADGSTRSAPAAALAGTLDVGLLRHAEDLAFHAGMIELLIFESSRGFEPEDAKVAALEPGRERAERAIDLLTSYGTALGDARRAPIVEREAAAAEAAGLPLVAALIRLSFGTEDLDTRIAAARRHLDGGSTYDHVELAYQVAGRLIGAKKTEEGRAAVRDVPGTTWGARRRAQLLAALRAMDAARAAAEAIEYPRLRAFVLEESGLRR